MREPRIKRAAVFVDGQNLFHAAKREFGHLIPNYDIGKLAAAVCRKNGWQLRSIRFYTGVPDSAASPKWRAFWAARFREMHERGIEIVSRPLRYDRRPRAGDIGREKGIDVRLALDAIAAANENECDVAAIFSQDQDLAEVAAEIRRIAVRENRWIKIACAYPLGEKSANRRGINGADWISIDRAIYDSCVDSRDYFPRAARAGR